MPNEIKCFDLPEGFDEEHFPNTAKYIRLHGTLKCASVWDLKHPYKSLEELYADCLKKGVTWKELLNFEKYDPNTLL